MQHKYVPYLLLACFGFSGLFDVVRPGQFTLWAVGVDVLNGFIISFGIFYWYCQDGNAREYRRSLMLNMGVVALAPLAIPIYLVRSRPAGTRWKALGRFLGLFCLLYIAAAVGVVVGLLARS